MLHHPTRIVEPLAHAYWMARCALLGFVAASADDVAESALFLVERACRPDTPENIRQRCGEAARAFGLIQTTQAEVTAPCDCETA